MTTTLDPVGIPDDEWEDAAVEQLRSDVLAYPGGAKKFVEDNQDRLGVGYFAFLDNLNGKNKIAYRTFTRTVHILGYTTQAYDALIDARIEAKRSRRSGQ